jgi:hypothetical protein
MGFGFVSKQNYLYTIPNGENCWGFLFFIYFERVFFGTQILKNSKICVPKRKKVVYLYIHHRKIKLPLLKP